MKKRTMDTKILDCKWGKRMVFSSIICLKKRQGIEWSGKSLPSTLGGIPGLWV